MMAMDHGKSGCSQTPALACSHRQVLDLTISKCQQALANSLQLFRRGCYTQALEGGRKILPQVLLRHTLERQPCRACDESLAGAKHALAEERMMRTLILALFLVQRLGEERTQHVPGVQGAAWPSHAVAQYPSSKDTDQIGHIREVAWDSSGRWHLLHERGSTDCEPWPSMAPWLSDRLLPCRRSQHLS